MAVESWTKLLDRSKVGPHAEHFFKIESAKDKVFTHVRMTIYPGQSRRPFVVGRKIGLETELGFLVLTPVSL